jgi:hypothetical protein
MGILYSSTAGKILYHYYQELRNFTHIVKSFLSEPFLERQSGQGGPVNWPAQAPNLTAMDFELWSFLLGWS